jgi:hypothetical protein
MKQILGKGLIFVLLFVGLAYGSVRAEQPIRAQQALGVQRILILAVSFSDTFEEVPLPQIRKHVLESTAEYYAQASYGKTTLTGDVKGWYKLPLPLSRYKVPADNVNLSRQRHLVQLLVQDALNAAEKDVVFSQYNHIIIVPGVKSTANVGYGTPCLAANAGALSGGQRGKARMVTITTRGGQQFSGGIIVVAQNVPYAHTVHDLAHAMGGVADGTRVIPCLYDARLQLDVGPLNKDAQKKFAVFMGPWDVMSMHFSTGTLLPPGMSSWTRLRMGWIDGSQVVEYQPGESRVVTLQPLGGGKGTLVVKMPGPGNTYYLLENRQKLPGDLIPTSGLLVLHVNDSLEQWEGILRVVDANPKVPYFGDATFGVGRGQNPSVNLKQDIGVEVLWQENMNLVISVTNKSIAPDIQSVAKRIREIDERLAGLPESSGSVQAKADLTDIKELLLRMRVDDAMVKIGNIRWP